jgi:hypothetical protein
MTQASEGAPTGLWFWMRGEVIGRVPEAKSVRR